MTLKRKLGIAAVLVVIVAAAVTAFREPSGSLLDVTFVRRDYGKDGAVIRITNRNPFEVVCTLSDKAAQWGIIRNVPSRGFLEVKVPEGSSTLWIGGSCQRMPSYPQLWLWFLQEMLLGDSSRREADWQISVGIPPSKTPLP